MVHRMHTTNGTAKDTGTAPVPLVLVEAGRRTFPVVAARKGTVVLAHVAPGDPEVHVYAGNILSSEVAAVGMPEFVPVLV